MPCGVLQHRILVSNRIESNTPISGLPRFGSTVSRLGEHQGLQGGHRPAASILEVLIHGPLIELIGGPDRLHSR